MFGFEAYLGALTIIVLGVFSAINLYDRYKKGNNQDTITDFKEAIDGMKARMGEMDEELKETRRNHQESLQKIAHLKGENETLTRLLLGRDPEAIAYREKSLEALNIIVSELRTLAVKIENHDGFVRKAHPEIG